MQKLSMYAFLISLKVGVPESEKKKKKSLVSFQEQESSDCLNMAHQTGITGRTKTHKHCPL